MSLSQKHFVCIKAQRGINTSNERIPNLPNGYKCALRGTNKKVPNETCSYRWLQLQERQSLHNFLGNVCMNTLHF